MAQATESGGFFASSTLNQMKSVHDIKQSFIRFSLLDGLLELLGFIFTFNITLL